MSDDGKTPNGSDIDADADALLASLTEEPEERDQLATIPGDESPVEERPRRPSRVTPEQRAPVLPQRKSGAPRIPRPTSTGPSPTSEKTAQPPSVNPAGPPRREPFPIATSPVAPRAIPRPVRRQEPPPPSFGDDEIAAVLGPLDEPPAEGVTAEESIEDISDADELGIELMDRADSDRPTPTDAPTVVARVEPEVSPDPDDLGVDDLLEQAPDAAVEPEVEDWSALRTMPPPPSFGESELGAGDLADELEPEGDSAVVSFGSLVDAEGDEDLARLTENEDDPEGALDDSGEDVADAVLTEDEEDFAAGFDYDDESLEDLGLALEEESSTSAGADDSDEHPAAAYLSRTGSHDEWKARAEWFEEEAQKLDDPQAVARTLLIASELWAITGDIERARGAATHAVRSASSPLAWIQSRHLAQASEDWKAVVLALDTEARTAPTAEARAHASYVSAEIHRLKLDDRAGSERRLDHASRAWASEPRPYVVRAVEQLAASPRPPKLRAPDAPELASLATALGEAAMLRGAATEDGEVPLAVAFDRARRALAQGDRLAAAKNIRCLEKLAPIRRAARWLAAALLAPEPDGRRDAVDLLRKLLEERPTAALRVALAARALELGDKEAITMALGDEVADGAFTAADRVALAALTGAEPESMSGPIATLLETDDQKPLAAAAASAITPRMSLRVSDSGANAESALGRKLASVKDAASLGESLEAVASTAPESPLVALLRLELAWAAEKHDDVARLVKNSAGAETDPAAPELAAALIAEKAGLLDVALKAYRAALSSEAFGEAAMRALTAHSPPETQADLLSLLANTLPDGSGDRRALLLFEAAVRRLADAPSAAAALAQDSLESAPELPLAHRLCDRLARLSGDAARVVDLLGRHRQTSLDAMERAFDLVREALLRADDDPTAAAALLSEALEARPDDVALRELWERLALPPAEDRASWREQAAERLDDAPTKSRLLLEAAFDYESSKRLKEAARAAERAAAHAPGDSLARLTAHRLVRHGDGAARRAEELLEAAKAESDPVVQRELYEELSQLDEARGDAAGALMWQRVIFESTPDYLPALRALEHRYVSEAREDELEAIAARIASIDDVKEAPAHAALALRLRSRHATFAEGRDLVELACRFDPIPLWALRARAGHAAAERDESLALEAQRALLDRVSRPLDVAALAVRAAESAVALGQLDVALDLLDRAIDQAPAYLVARAARAELRRRREDYRGAATDLEVIAAESAERDHRAAAWRAAGVLYFDHVDDAERGAHALEQTVALDATDDDTFDRLQLYYVQTNDRAKLAALLEGRLKQTTDPEERIALEVTRGRALADVGDRAAAREALHSALEANPEHTDALDVYATLCAAEGDYQGAEQAWLRLARVAQDPARQADIYRKLAALYATDLPNPQRVEVCYREVLKRHPNDVEASVKLVELYIQQKEGGKAVELQTALLDRAGSPEEKRDRTLGLARVFEGALDDRKRALSAFEKARKAWPHDAHVLRALAEFHHRGGESAALAVLLERSTSEARRALAHGRFDAAFFEILITAAELRGGEDAALVAGATLAALEGRESSLPGAGAAAGSVDLDDLLAPDLLTAAFRAFFKKIAGVLDAAFPTDLRALAATPLPAEDAEFVAAVRQVAASLGVQQIEVLVSPALGPVWLPASATPPRIVIGRPLLEMDDPARYFALFQCLKTIQNQTAPFARIAPIDAMPTLAALLSTFAPSYQPGGVDAARYAAAKKRVEANRLPRIDNDVPMLALEIGGVIGNRASQLGTAINQWANRAALLAVGDPSIAFRAISRAQGAGKFMPDHGPERLKWIVRNAEARDLAVFSVSDAYAQARGQVGL